jgi:flavin-dependent dehydrogenase
MPGSSLNVAVGIGSLIQAIHQVSPSISPCTCWLKAARSTVIWVEARPIPEHPRPRRVIGRVALVGDAAGYVTKCSGEGIYFSAKFGRLCGETIGKLWREEWKETKSGLKREYLKKWDDEFLGMSGTVTLIL